MDSNGVVDLSAFRETTDDRGPELQGDDLDVHHEEADPLEVVAHEEEGASLDEILWQYREAILDLHGRVAALEARPAFAQSVRGRRTGQ